MIPRATLVLTLTMVMVAIGVVRGQETGLDPSFGNSGLVFTDFARGADNAQGLAVEPGGTLIAVGFANRPGHSDVAVARYSPDGQLIAAVTIDIHPGEYRNEGASRVAILPDGRLILGGIDQSAHTSTNYDVMLLRLLPTLALDPSFGTDGVVITPFSGYGWVTALALEPDGRIILSGAFGLMRYNDNGSLDTTFGVGGRVAPVLSSNEYITSVAVLGDERILAVGATFDRGSNEIGLTRFLSNGSVDSSFGIAGKVLLGNYSAVPYVVAVQTDGRLVAAGGAFVDGGMADFVVWRFEENGVLDPSFGTGGRAFADFGGHDSAYALALQTDGRIVAAGQSSQPGNAKSVNFAVARFEPNGNLDSTFGTDGRAVTDFFGEYDLANAVAIQPGRGIVVAGVIGNPQNGTSDFGLARYDGPPNQLPVISLPFVSPATLWPPNHRLVVVRVDYDAIDDRDDSPACALSVASNEPIDGAGDGRTARDWQVIDGHQVRLRSERSATGKGRIYTITITCSDSAGLAAQRQVQVSVPKSR